MYLQCWSHITFTYMYTNPLNMAKISYMYIQEQKSISSKCYWHSMLLAYFIKVWWFSVMSILYVLRGICPYQAIGGYRLEHRHCSMGSDNVLLGAHAKVTYGHFIAQILQFGIWPVLACAGLSWAEVPRAKTSVLPRKTCFFRYCTCMIYIYILIILWSVWCKIQQKCFHTGVIIKICSTAPVWKSASVATYGDVCSVSSLLLTMVLTCMC